MDPKRWEKVGEIFSEAAELDAEDRAVFVKEACGDDAELLAEVESLLAAGIRAGNFISQPIVDRFAPELADHLNALSPGSTVAHYHIERAIGSGGMGEVYLATDSKLGRSVALKTLPRSFAADPSFLKRFRNEAFAAANLNHPNAATVYSVEEFEGMPFITMEYVDGKTLDQLTPETGLDVKTFLTWLEPIADALSHAHKRGIIHRDIKPSNIMISADGTPKILDFGLAYFERSLAGGPTRGDITAPGQIIGTPSYMSPEHAEGGSIDARSDIFSFGTVMYEALTGKRPFRGPSQGLIVRSVIHDTPVPISKLRDDAPAVLVEMIDHCLQKSPSKRFQKMREVHGIFKDLRAANSEGVSLDSFARRFYREATSPSKLWWAAGALVVLVFAVSGWYMFSREPEPPFQFEHLSLRKLSQSNDVIYAHITPDGNSIAYVTTASDNKRGMYIRNIADRNALELVPPSPIQFWGGMAISSDASSVYYIAAERAARHGTVFRVSSRGGPPRKIVDMVNDLGSLSPDGERLLFVRYGDPTELISCKAVDGSDERVLATGSEGNLFRDPHYSVDGSSVFVIRFERLAGVESWSLVEIPAGGGGDERVLVPKQKPRINEIAVLKDGRNLLLNSTDPLTNLPQIYNLSLDTGRLSRVTNDINFYFGISVDSEGQKVVTAQRFDSMRVWVAETSDPASMKPITPEPNAWLETGWTPDGRIVYDAVDNNLPHIYIINRDGTGLQQLTPSGSNDSHPRVTPDGRFIVFTSDRTGDNRVWRMNIDGSDPIQLSPDNGVGENPELSADGKWVYFSFSNVEVVGQGRIPINGGPMTIQRPSSENYWVPAPNGRQVAITHPSEDHVNPMLGIASIGEDTPFKLIDVWPIYVLRWSPDSSKILFREREVGANPYSSLWEYDLQNDKQRLVFDVSPDVLRDAAFSPDGRFISLIRGTLVTDAVMITNVAATPATK